MSLKETTVERQVRISAPIHTVWNELNSTGLSSLHLMRPAEPATFEEGRPFIWMDLEGPQDKPAMKGQITVLQAPRRIVYRTFLPGLGLEDAPENYTLVDLTLAEEEDGRTLVTVSHGDFANYPHGHRIAKKAGDSWVDVLIRLKDKVEREQAA